ncbi:MAG: energy transducer TonB family protein, partial [Bryobacteraceae bacterium]
PEPPQVQIAENRLPTIAPPVLPPPAPEKPKIAFESPATVTAPAPTGRIPMPGTSVADAVRGAARGGVTGGIVVGDSGAGPGGIGEMLNQTPAPGRQGSTLELLSDPMGVDFRPYLIRILGSVRRNWWAVMPESAKLGRRGRVAIQFSIDREGRVPKLVIALGSGTDALDRAAVAGISASNPFPPLPAEFRGQQIRLQFNFAYNMPAN